MWNVTVAIDPDKVGDDKSEAAQVSAVLDYGDGTEFHFTARTDKSDLVGDRGFVQKALDAKAKSDTLRAQGLKFAAVVADQLDSAAAGK